MALNGLFCADVPLRNYALINIIYSHNNVLKQTERQPKKQYNQYSSQNTKARKTSQTDALKYPRDCPHTEYTEHSLLDS